MYCRSCGRMLPDDSVFCNYCGATQHAPVSPTQHPNQAPLAQQTYQPAPPVYPTVQEPVYTPGEPLPANTPKRKNALVPILIGAVFLLAICISVIMGSKLLNKDSGSKNDDNSDRVRMEDNSVSLPTTLPAVPSALPPTTNPTTEPSPEEEPFVPTDPNDIPDIMISSNGQYEVAFIQDVGSLKDRSYNEYTYNGVKLFAYITAKSYKYYTPAGGNNPTEEDRYNAMKQACDNGAKAVVAAGFMQADAMARAAKDYPNVKFIFIDGWDLGLDNVIGVVFREEQAGYWAGYAAVMEGYTKLGFMGGGSGTNPACCRYGYGFVQGVEAAAAKLGVQVEVKYSWLYGTFFSASADLENLATSWYQNGTQTIFVCGGGMFISVCAAAEATGGKVIGADVDQSFTSHCVITSAIKWLDWGAYQALEAAQSEASWKAFRHHDSLRLHYLDMCTGSVGIPTDTWSLKRWAADAFLDEYSKASMLMSQGLFWVDDAVIPYPSSTSHVTIEHIK